MTHTIEIPPDYLESIAQDSDRIPRLYYSKNTVLRKMFWRRLYRLTGMVKSTLGNHLDLVCLDFGGGSGVFLPTLSKLFKKVTLVDLEAEQANLIRSRYQLENTEVVSGDIANLNFECSFDAIIAADVLEHFKDLSMPIGQIKRWLKTDGYLYTSLPTENWVYVILRKFFGVEKPWDHYHTAYEVEDRLLASGFLRVKTSAVPLHFPIAPLFLVTAWKLKP